MTIFELTLKENGRGEGRLAKLKRTRRPSEGFRTPKPVEVSYRIAATTSPGTGPERGLHPKRPWKNGRVRGITMQTLFFSLLLSLGTVVQGQSPTFSPQEDTARPTDAPTIPAPTLRPTISPTSLPTVSEGPTSLPTSRPTSRPTFTPTARPTSSIAPSVSKAPSHVPTRSPQPSNTPTVSLKPSQTPSLRPTVTPVPTEFPSFQPSDVPSSIPSGTPSELPTYSEPFESRQQYSQAFVKVPLEFFNDSEKSAMVELYASYTPRYIPDGVPPDRINTFCGGNGDDGLPTQGFVDCTPLDPCGNETEQLVDVFFYCAWNSSVTEVDSYPPLFRDFINENLDEVSEDLRSRGVTFVEALSVKSLTPQTSSPTSSAAPTGVRSEAPTKSPAPSELPSQFPSDKPNLATFPPVADPTLAPTPPAGDGEGGLGVGGIAGIVVGSGLAVLAGLVMLYYRRIKKPLAQADAVPPGQSKGSRYLVEGGSDMAFISPSESLVSNKSMLSTGEVEGFGDEFGDEADGRRHLQDEFDKYKDQNLEELRSNVEGNLQGFEGIMSAAMTNVLMGDEENRVDPAELLWGCHGSPKGPEVEASALCEVNDWLKRNESATTERKRVFMQDLLNKMVASVRYGVLNADDASRTIHESAALLGLSLANELPMTTVIISGMRKTVTASHMMHALREFGDIDTAAVASGQRGFGIVRFRNSKSVEKAMRRYRDAEIVVQDVAVQLKVLMPSGRVETRARERDRQSGNIP